METIPAIPAIPATEALGFFSASHLAPAGGHFLRFAVVTQTLISCIAPIFPIIPKACPIMAAFGGLRDGAGHERERREIRWR